MADNVWTETFYVHSYEIDPTGRATVLALCSYLQEIAGNHAGALGVSLERLSRENRTWVLSRLYLQMDRYPRWQESVRIETWPSGENGLMATREFDIRDADGADLGRATSAWLMIDTERRRPVRMPEYITELDLPDRGRVLDGTKKLPAPENTTFETSFEVRYTDLDLNGHVNNVRYAEWAVKTLPDKILRSFRPTSLQIEYKAETRSTDTILGEAGRLSEQNHTFAHRLTRTGDDREVALLKSRWVPRQDG